MIINYNNVAINKMFISSIFEGRIMISKVDPSCAGFVIRLKDACDKNPNIPEFGQGQQTHIAKKLKQSAQTVHRWFDGVAKPRPDTMKKLAKLLGVDEVWLAMGKAPELQGSKAKKQYKAKADGAVYLLFGMFTIHGHVCAFSADGNEETDFFAIKGGRQQAISVTAAHQKSDDVYTIPARLSFEETVNFAVIALPRNRYDVLYLDNDGIQRHAENKGMSLEITIHKNGGYATGRHEWALIEDSGLL